MTKKYLGFILKNGVSLALIVYLLYTQDLDAIGQALKTYDPMYFAFAFILSVAGIFVSSLRWQIILKTSGVNVEVRRLAALYTKGYFYNNFLPTQMGGDVYKAVSLGRKINNQSVAVFSVFMDRFSGLIVLLVMALFGISSLFGWRGVVSAIILLVAGLVFYFPVLTFVSKKVRKLSQFKEASEVFIKDKQRGFFVIILSILVQLFSFCMVYVLFMGLGIVLPIQSVFANLPIASLSTLIPSFNGFGTQDTVYAFLFDAFGITAALSITVSFLVHAVRLILSLIGGILILFGIEK